MSGIYIPGMEMPTTCFECPFMFARRYCCVDLTLDLYQGDYEELKGRVDGCPLVHVPEHGDLIDKQYAYQNTMTLGEHTRKIVLKQIDALPVVIPADKDEQT